MKRISSCALAIAVSLCSSLAAAQSKNDFSAGTFSVGVERLSGFVHSHHSTDGVTAGGFTTAGTSSSADTISLLGQDATGPYDLPRIGVDYFFWDNVSLGGSLVLIHTDVSGAAAGVTTTGSGTAFAFMPRVGYAMMFNEVVGFWPRGGLSYFLDSFDNGSIHYFSFDVDVPFIFELTPTLAITAGPTFDVSFEGKVSNDNPGGGSTSRGTSYWAFGIQGGLALFF